MKKVFAFMMVALAIFAVSCSKQDGKGGKGGKSTYQAPITIDGDFSDWAALPAANVAVANLPDGAPATGLKTLKAYADNVCIFIYFKLDKEVVQWGPDVTFQEDGEDVPEMVPFHIYINSDNDLATGGYGDQFADVATDILMEGALIDTDETFDYTSYDPGVFTWAGEPGGTGWTWAEATVAENPCQGAGKGSEYELRIIRALMPAIADTFAFGVDIQQAWDSVGILPLDAATDDNPAGKAHMLQVVTVK